MQISPELVLVATPEEAAHARSLLPDPPSVFAQPVPSPDDATAAPARVGPELGSLALLVYTTLLLAGVAFVAVAIAMHEVRSAAASLLAPIL